MTFPIMKRINTELLIDRNNELYLQKGDKETDQEITELLEEGKTEKAGMKTWQPVCVDLHFMEGKTN